MEYHKGRNIDRLKVADINKYILYLVNEKKISVSQQNMRINAIKFYYEQVKGGKRQYYGGITRAKEYKSLPEVLSRNEVCRILSCLSNRKHRCMISLIYSAGLRRSELLNLTPKDIISERMLVRIMGKGRKCRYSLLSEKLLEELQSRLSEHCLNFSQDLQNSELLEELAMCDENVLEQYLETGSVEEDQIRTMIAERKVFPCCFGSALKMEGVTEFLKILDRFTKTPEYGGDFGARVF